MARSTAGAAQHQDWRGKRDLAMLTLLYGCGLRIDEALKLNATVALDQSYIVDGKGSKQRMVPVLPAVTEAIAVYLNPAPTS